MSFSNFLLQSYGKLAYIDILLVCFYLCMCLYIGAKNVGRIKSLKDYALGTEPISTAALVATIYASYLGAGATIGTIEKIAALGLLFAITVLFNPVRWALSIFIYGENIDQFRGCITINDIMARLYGNTGRIVTCIANIFNSIIVVAVQAMALGYCFHYFLEIPASIGICIGVGTITFYSALGGIRAVVVTDMLQFGIFYIIIPLICGITIYKCSGFGSVIDHIPAQRLEVQINQNNWSMFIGCILYAVIPYNPAVFIQRFLMSKNSIQLKRVLWIVMFVDISIVLITCILGLVLTTDLNDQISSQIVLWHTLNENLFTILKGIAVLGILAIIMSTADSYVNVIGVMAAHDIAKQLYPNITDKMELKIAWITTLCAGIFAIILALYGSSIWHIIWIAISLTDPLFTLPLIAGFLKFRTNSTSFIVSSILAIMGSIIGFYCQHSFDVLSLIFGFTGSAVGLFGTHYIQKGLGVLDNIAPQEKIELQKWYEEQSMILGVPVHNVPSKLKALAKLEEKQYQINYKVLYHRAISIFRKLIRIRMKDLVFYSQRTVARYGEKYYEFAFFGLLFCIYPLIFLNSTYELYPVADQHPMWYGSVVLRVMLGFGCLSIGLQHRWQPENVRKYMPLYFHFMVMCTLPALSTYSYLVSPNDEHMLIGGIISIFSLTLLLDWLTFSIITPLGILLGHLIYMFVGYQLVEYQGMYQDNIDGTILYIIFVIITAFVLHFIESKRDNKLYIRAYHDALTNLMNRHYLDDHLNKLIKDSHTRGNPLSIITMDIDHFKKINDTYGHDIGDKVLQHLSRLILDSSRPLDICGRLGGEEFIIILPNTTLDQAKDIAERFREKVKITKLKIQHKRSIINLQYTISIGVADLKPGYTKDLLMKLADNTLYQAKRLGRNRVEVLADKFTI